MWVKSPYHVLLQMPYFRERKTSGGTLALSRKVPVIQDQFYLGQERCRQLQPCTLLLYWRKWPTSDNWDQVRIPRSTKTRHFLSWICSFQAFDEEFLYSTIGKLRTSWILLPIYPITKKRLFLVDLRNLINNLNKDLKIHLLQWNTGW